MQLAVSVFLVRADYVFLRQRKPSARPHPGYWQSVFFNLQGYENAVAVARRRIRNATGIHLRRERFQLLGKIHLSADPKRPCRLKVFRVELRHGEVLLCKGAMLLPWMPFPIGEVPGLRPMTPALKYSLDLLFSQGGIRP